MTIKAMTRFLLACLFTGGVVPVAAAADPPKAPAAKAVAVPDTESEVYKTVGDVTLKAYLFKPADWKPTDRRPAIVLFFGGGWTNGTPTHFEPQCRHLASRGMVAIAPDYRVKSRQGVTPAECVADAKSAVRWARANAERLGIDPTRIAAGGGSAGGHIAACAALAEKFDEPGEDAKVSSRPNALVLFNPALDVAKLTDRMGERAAELSPLQNVKAGAPPTLILTGKDDTTTPYAAAEAFAAAMRKVGSRCELVGYAGQKHGFFRHRGPDGGEMYRQTTKEADAFLVSLGYLADR